MDILLEEKLTWVTTVTLTKGLKTCSDSFEVPFTRTKKFKSHKVAAESHFQLLLEIKFDDRWNMTKISYFS